MIWEVQVKSVGILECWDGVLGIHLVLLVLQAVVLAYHALDDQGEELVELEDDQACEKEDGPCLEVLASWGDQECQVLEAWNLS